jgi:hypothetical protein
MKLNTAHFALRLTRWTAWRTFHASAADVLANSFEVFLNFDLANHDTPLSVDVAQWRRRFASFLLASNTKHVMCQKVRFAEDAILVARSKRKNVEGAIRFDGTWIAS